MTKDKLRAKLLEARQQYLEKNKTRIDKLEPLWSKAQQNLPKIEDIEPFIDFCDTQEKQDLWWYGRVTVSSAPLSGEVGRRIHYLVRDKTTGFILGMVGLASDLTIPIRDKHIGWNNKNKWDGKRINYLMNCQHVVSTPEFSKYLVGKLCALSVTSKEVQEYFKTKYGHDIALMTVTSLFGESSMYNRLLGFEFLGCTKGFSSVLIPLSIKEKMREDYKATKGKHSEIYYNKDGSVKDAYGIVKGYQKLSKYVNVQSEENFRGVYIIPVSYNYKEFLRQETDILQPFEHPTFSAVWRYWKVRWLTGRIERINAGLV